MKSVTVIVPAYNARDTIGACIESLLGQTRRPDEVIIVDDCSRDDTARVALNYGVKVIKLEKNSGPGVARNIGAAAAAGEILAFTDSDCVAPPDWLERIVGALDAPGVVAATGGYAGPVQDGFLTRLQHLIIRQRQSALPPEIDSTITSNFACLKSAFEFVGGFPLYYLKRDPTKPIWGNEDEELGFLLTRAGGKIRWMSDIGVLHLFRLSLTGYLRQQRFYAERIIMSHFRFPEMARSRTNYSRLNGALHLGSILGLGLGLFALLAWLAGLGGMQWVAAGLLGVSAPVYLLLPIPVLLDLRRRGQNGKFVTQAYVVLLAVDIAWLSGAVTGTMLSLGGFIDGNRESSAAFAAADQ
ncbi:MAG: glycosyltransferase [Burkholderiales bacterium]|nr:glycosyltransferase [Burkholderiales bacterium]